MTNKKDRISVGIDGIDEILEGGFLKGQVYLICGGPGSGKTIFGEHFLDTGVKDGEHVLFISMAEHEPQIKTNMQNLGLDTNGISFLDLTPNPDFFLESKAYDIFSPAEVERQPTSELIINAVKSARPTRVLIDALTQFRYLSSDEFQFRKQVLSLFQFLKEQKATVVITSEGSAQQPDDDLKFLCDGIIQLNNHNGIRTISVPKFRGSSFRSGEHTMRITKTGIKVFPQLLPEEHHKEFVPTPIPSGIPEIDQMLAGGLESGTITIITGPSGVGKTSLGLSFMKEAAKSQGRSVIYCFEEDLDTLIARSQGINIPISELIKRNALSLVHVEPQLYFPDEFANMVRAEVEANHPKMIMIDSIAGYKISMRGEDLTSHLHSLCKYLKNMGTSVLLINESEYITGEFRATEVGISYLADNLIFMRYYEFDGAMHRSIGILKKRVTNHEKTIREYQITSEGIKVGIPLKGIQGILRGIPEFIKKGD